MPAAEDHHDVLDVLDALDALTRPGAARERLLVHAGAEDGAVDARLVSDLLRQAGRVGDTLQTRRALVGLCGILRAMEAAMDGRVDLAELHDGLRVHAARTDRFHDFHDARVLLRTLGEVLEHHVGRERAAAAQVRLLHAELRAWLLGQLVGDAPPQPAPAAPSTGTSEDPRARFLVRDPGRRRSHDGLVEELLHGADGYPVTGLLGAAWRRDWSAVPVPEEMLGDDPSEVERLAGACASMAAGRTPLVQVARQRGPMWRLRGTALELLDGLRDSWELPPGARGVELASTPRPGWTILTTATLDFAYVEAAGHHAVLGPSAFVEQVVGMPPLEAVARFRVHVEQLAGDEGPPPDLLEVATSFGRLRRRSR